jgi:hypothetical protein
MRSTPDMNKLIYIPRTLPHIVLSFSQNVHLLRFLHGQA